MRNPSKLLLSTTKIMPVLMVLGLVLNAFTPVFAQTEAETFSAIDKKDTLISFCKSTGAEHLLFIQDGKQQFRWKSTECDSSHFNSASLVKSLTGVAVGILVHEGFIISEEELYCNYVPEWLPGCRDSVTIKHLLTMSAGINKKRGSAGILAARNLNEYALNVELDTLPGIRFNYSNAAVQLLGILIEASSGMRLQDFFREYLFRPMNMDSSSLYTDAFDQACAFGGARMTPEDLSQFGLMILDKGLYKGKRIVSEDWITKLLTPSDKADFYGYLWWLGESKGLSHGVAMGDGGQVMLIIPETRTLVIRARSCIKAYNDMRWLTDFVALASRINGK